MSITDDAHSLTQCNVYVLQAAVPPILPFMSHHMMPVQGSGPSSGSDLAATSSWSLMAGTSFDLVKDAPNSKFIEDALDLVGATV